jgi:hypothetical protein
MRKSKLSTVTILTLLLLSMFSVLAFTLTPQVQATTAVIVRVQGPCRGTTTGSSISITMDQSPTNGNVIVLDVGTVNQYAEGASVVTSVSQPGVTWSKQYSFNLGSSSLVTVVDSEIWYGVIGASAGTTISITLSKDATWGGVADACEYSGMLTSGYYDQMHMYGNIGVPTLDTGTTPMTTQANELWIAVITQCTISTNLSSPTNGFTLLDGVQSSDCACGYLEKIVTSTGQADVALTGENNNYGWTGIIITFKAASPGISATVTLSAPSNGFAQYSHTVTFNYTPVVIADTLYNASLWTNATGSWALTQTNTTLVLNNTVNSIQYLFASTGIYLWNIQVFTATGVQAFALSNWTVTVSSTSGTLISHIQTLVQNTVNWTSGDVAVALIGYNMGNLTLAQLQGIIDASTSWTTVLYGYAQIMKYGVENQTKIEWALDNATLLANSLPATYNSSGNWIPPFDCFLINNRFCLYGYYWAQKYGYELDKWNLTNAYYHYDYATGLTNYHGWTFVKGDDTTSCPSNGPRYYDEAAQTLDGFLIFYNLGVTAALSEAAKIWSYINNNFWDSVNNYFWYLPTVSDYECEAGGFDQVALILKYLQPSTANISRVTTDMLTRFIAKEWASPQWSAAQGVVIHANPSNQAVRLENTLMAWNSIMGNSYNLNSDQRNNVTNLLIGYGSYDPAWLRLYESGLWGATQGLNMFRMTSNDFFTPSSCNAPTAYACQLLLLNGIVPSSGAVAMPLSDLSYEDFLSSVDKQMCSLDIVNRNLTLPIGQIGIINFTFGSSICGYTFPSTGVYNLTFASDWNSISSVTRTGDLPTNRMYFTVGDSIPPTYTNVSYNSTKAGLPCQFNVTVNDNVQNGYYIFGSNITGSWLNETPVAFSTTPQTVSTVKTLSNSNGPNTSVGNTIQWDYWFNDTSGNLNNTGIRSLVLTPAFNITASAGSGGSISPSGTLTVDGGSNWTFAMNPNSGMAVDSVLVDGINQGTVNFYTFTNVQANHTIVANFGLMNFTITASSDIHSSITPSGSMNVTIHGSQTFNMSATLGYVITHVYVDGVDQGAISSYTFTNVMANHTISVVSSGTYVITVIYNTGGAIAPGNSTYNPGASQTFNITPSTGYHTVVVYVDGASQGVISSYLFSNIQADHNITATFAITTFNITASSDAQSTITPSGVIILNYGSGQGFAMAPNTGYHLAHVYVDGVDQGTISSYTFSNVIANHTISVTSAINTYAITVRYGTGGTISPGNATYNYGSDQIFTISPSTGYQIGGVTVDGVSQGAISSYSFTNIQANHTISATFGAISNFTITAQADAHSTITPSGNVSVAYGASQQFNMTANNGYNITHVVIDAVDHGVLNNYTFTNVQANHTISVTTTQNIYNITASAGSGGSISPSGNVQVGSGNAQAFIISANTGYNIASVLVDNVSQGAIASYTFTNVVANHTISVTFAIHSYNIAASADENATISPSGNVAVTYGNNQTFLITTNGNSSIIHVYVDLIDQGRITNYTFHNVQANHTILVETAPICFYFHLKFVDTNGTDISSRITWELYNGSTFRPYADSDPSLLNGTYTLRSYFQGMLLNISTLRTWQVGNGTITIPICAYLQTTAQGGYIVANVTVTITILRQDDTNLTFSGSYANPIQLILNVPNNATAVFMDGVAQPYGTVWTWDPTNKTITIKAPHLSVWQLLFPQIIIVTPPPPGYNSLTISVTNNGQPASGIIVSVNGISQTTGADGTTTFTLASGTYTVTCEGQTQILAITANTNTSFDITPGAAQASLLPYEVAVGSLIAVMVVCFAILIIVRRKKS